MPVPGTWRSRGEAAPRPSCSPLLGVVDELVVVWWCCWWCCCWAFAFGSSSMYVKSERGRGPVWLRELRILCKLCKLWTERRSSRSSRVDLNARITRSCNEKSNRNTPDVSESCGGVVFFFNFFLKNVVICGGGSFSCVIFFLFFFRERKR